jgi:penicillin-binding protein-related factor A (putative recombinase)
MSQQSANKKQGNAGENEARKELEKRGVSNVEFTPVEWVIIRGKSGRIINAFPKRKDKATNDISGIIAGSGRSVRAEVKTTDGTLPYKMLDDKQHEALQLHHDLGGLSLLVWVHDGIVSVMRYPIAGFRKYTSIKAANVVEWGIDEK